MRIPKYKSCTKDESCRSCKKATLDDQEKFEENARKRNLKYFKYAELYLEVCEKQAEHLKLTEEFLKQINEIQNELKQQHFNMAQELELNLYPCGHYATETFGVKALAEELANHFKIE